MCSNAVLRIVALRHQRQIDSVWDTQPIVAQRRPQPLPLGSVGLRQRGIVNDQGVLVVVIGAAVRPVVRAENHGRIAAVHIDDGELVMRLAREVLNLDLRAQQEVAHLVIGAL